MNKLKKEYLFFKQQEPNMRTLLVTNMLYALVLPIVEIFVGAYICLLYTSPFVEADSSVSPTPAISGLV